MWETVCCYECFPGLQCWESCWEEREQTQDRHVEREDMSTQSRSQEVVSHSILSNTSENVYILCWVLLAFSWACGVHQVIYRWHPQYSQNTGSLQSSVSEGARNISQSLRQSNMNFNFSSLLFHSPSSPFSFPSCSFFHFLFKSRGEGRIPLERA